METNSFCIQCGVNINDHDLDFCERQRKIETIKRDRLYLKIVPTWTAFTENLDQNLERLERALVI